MDKSIILELVASGKCYMDGINFAKNEEYEKYKNELHEMLETFCKDMPEDEKHEIFWKFDMAQGGLEAVTADEYFKEGFKLGLILAAQNFL